MKPTAIITCAILAFSIPAHAGNAPAEAQQKLDVLLDATQANDLEKFESVCDATMQEAMTAEKLAEVATQIAGEMKKGYKKEYFGVVDRLAAKTHYWKLTFETEGLPEVLVEMSIADGKVAGFFLR